MGSECEQLREVLKVTGVPGTGTFCWLLDELCEAYLSYLFF